MRPPPRPRLLAAALLLGLLVVTGCAKGKEGQQPRPRERTSLLVENRSFLDMNVYVVAGGSQRVRLGRAGGNSTTRFTIPPNLIFGVTSLRFIADPIGAGRLPVSDDIQVTEGDEVRLIIPP